ncbi:MAG: hypothetical protein WCP39_04325, partial [Chlamydiota bacterium]
CMGCKGSEVQILSPRSFLNFVQLLPQQPDFQTYRSYWNVLKTESIKKADFLIFYIKKNI